jgi:putative FmdB family regulatory protein
MPLYEYCCKKCEKQKEIMQKLKDDPPICCNKKMERILSLSSFRLKGSGWYKDGYSAKKKNK